MKYIKSRELYESEQEDLGLVNLNEGKKETEANQEISEEELNEFDMPSFWEFFQGGAGWELGKAAVWLGLALSMVVLGGVVATGATLIAKARALYSDYKDKKGAKEAIDFMQSNAKVKELIDFSKELIKHRKKKVDKRRKNSAEDLKALKKEEQKMIKQRQQIGADLVGEMSKAKLSGEAIDWLAWNVPYVKTALRMNRLSETLDYVKTFELYEARNVRVKRKYTDVHPEKSVSKYAPVREAILRHVKENGGVISKEDLNEFIKGMNEDRGTKTTMGWVRRNARYIKETKTGYKLTSLGERVLKATSLNENESLNEGQFSWMTHDGGTQIGSENANRIEVTMFDDKGNKWVEKKYEGYGEFGGKDYYVLLAEMNGVTKENVDDLIKAHKVRTFGNDYVKKARQIGIDLAFGENKSLTVACLKLSDSKKAKIKFPALYKNPGSFKANQHDFYTEADSDPNQSWFTSEYDDDDEYGW